MLRNLVSKLKVKVKRIKKRKIKRSHVREREREGENLGYLISSIIFLVSVRFNYLY